MPGRRRSRTSKEQVYKRRPAAHCHQASVFLNATINISKCNIALKEKAMILLEKLSLSSPLFLSLSLCQQYFRMGSGPNALAFSPPL